MADQRSVEMLVFNFARRIFAFKRLAQGLSRSVFAFSSFMRVVVLFWARVLRYLAKEEARFRMRIILGVVLIRSLACTQWFREASGVAPEWPCNIGFMRKSSRRAKVPSMRFFVLLNSFDNLFVILPSIFQET